MKERRVHGPAALTAVAATKYTVGAGLRAIIRQIHVENVAAGPINFTLSIGVDAAGTRLFDAYTIAAGAVFDWFCYIPMAAAEVIQAFASVAQGTLTISADEDAA